MVLGTKFSLSTGRVVLSFLPRHNSEGENPVIECGEDLYARRAR